MAINTISYTNKSDINTTTTPVQNKVSATDMNEIKSVVNSNASLMGDLTTLTTTDKSSIVGAINEVIQDIKDYNTFDSNEVETDETWIDGSKIYKKTITMNIGTSINYTQAHNITTSNISKIWIDQANSYWVSPIISETLGHYNGTDDYSRFYLTTGSIVCVFASQYSSVSKTAYATIKYVKS